VPPCYHAGQNMPYRMRCCKESISKHTILKL
jgi:hypothetical protein